MISYLGGDWAPPRETSATPRRSWFIGFLVSHHNSTAQPRTAEARTGDGSSRACPMDMRLIQTLDPFEKSRPRTFSASWLICPPRRKAVAADPPPKADSSESKLKGSLGQEIRSLSLTGAPESSLKRDRISPCQPCDGPFQICYSKLCSF